MERHVFVAYSPQDRAAATAVCLALEGENLRGWMAPRDLTPDMTEEEATQGALKTTLLMVLVVSPSSSHSPMILHQVTAAVSSSLPLLLFRVGQAPLSRPMQVLLSEPEWLDASDPPEPSELKAMVDSVFPRLVREAERRLKPWDEDSIKEKLEDARVLLRYRMVDKAVAKLVDLKTTYFFHPAVREELIQAYQDLGRLRDVAGELQELSRLYDALGQRERASELLERARELTPLAPHPAIELEPVEEHDVTLADPAATHTLSPDDLVDDV